MGLSGPNQINYTDDELNHLYGQAIAGEDAAIPSNAIAVGFTDMRGARWSRLLNGKLYEIEMGERTYHDCVTPAPPS